MVAADNAFRVGKCPESNEGLPCGSSDDIAEQIYGLDCRDLRERLGEVLGREL